MIQRLIHFLVHKIKITRLNGKAGIKLDSSCILGSNVKIHIKNGHFIAGNRTSLYHGIEATVEDSSVHIGNHCQIKKEAEISCKNQGQIVLGNEVAIGKRSEIICENAVVRIGNHTRIAAEVVLITNNHNISDLTTPIMYQGKTHKDIHIHDNVWIGRKAIILPGVTLEEGCVVGAGAIVTKSFPKNSIIGGNPARLIRVR